MSPKDAKPWGQYPTQPSMVAARLAGTASLTWPAYSVPAAYLQLAQRCLCDNPSSRPDAEELLEVGIVSNMISHCDESFVKFLSHLSAQVCSR